VDEVLAPLRRAVVYAEEDHRRTERYAFAGGEATAFSARSPFKVTVNEDALALIPVGEQSGILVIADGLGGLPAGEVAARTVVSTLQRAVAGMEPGLSLRETILDGIERANAAIMALGTGSATTVAVVELQGSMMRSYHVGDSLILLVGQRGKLKFQSVSHSPVGYAVEAGLLDEAEAVHHEARSVVSNVLGSPEMRIDIGPALMLAPRDTLLLASDGLPDNLYIDEITAHVKAGPLLVAAERLVESCRLRMEVPQPHLPSHPDDLSVILYRCA